MPATTQATEVLHARAAFGIAHIGILFQRAGGPYANYFTVVTPDGTEVLPPVALDPPGRFGSFGGDVAFDGEGWVATFRTNDGMGGGQVHWVRISETTGETTGPVVVAASGAGDPHGAIPPFSFTRVAAMPGAPAVIAFVRERHDAVLDVDIPKAQVVTVDAGGTVLGTSFAGVEDDLTWHDEAHVFATLTGFVAVWSDKDLLAPGDTPPTRFRIAAGDGLGRLDPQRGAGTLLVSGAPEHRVEPLLVELPDSPLEPATDQLGTLAWLDERSYVDLLTGRIELYVAPVSKAFVLGEPVIFAHPRFIESTSDLRGARAGSNVLLVWIDERHGNGVVDPRPELWFETAWF
jgi:hypothetical protein